MASAGHVQLTQPVMSICWAGVLLRECIGWPMILGGVVVIACAFLAVRVRNRGSRG